MTFKIEDVKNDEDFKTYVTGLIATATEPLTLKNTQILDELKTTRAKAGSSLEDEELDELRAKAAKADEYETKKLESKGEYETLISKTKQQHTDAIATKDKEIETQASTIRALLVDGGLATALAEAKVNPALLKAAQKLLSDDVQVIEVEGKLVAMVGSKNIDEYVKEWAEGEVGKNFVLGDHNSGGGGDKRNPDGSGGGDGDYELYFQPGTINMTKQAECLTSDPDLYKKLNIKYNSATPRPQGMMS